MLTWWLTILRNVALPEAENKPVMIRLTFLILCCLAGLETLNSLQRDVVNPHDPYLL